MCSAAGRGFDADRRLACWYRHLSIGERLALALSLSLGLHASAMLLPGSPPRAASGPGMLSVMLQPSRGGGQDHPARAAVPPLLPASEALDPVLPPIREEASSSAASTPQAMPAETSVPVAAIQATEPTGGDEEGYFPAAALDVLAVPLQPIELALPPQAPAGELRVMLRVYINERGGVDAVVAEQPDSSGVLEHEARRVFLSARFAPARRHGVAVKSYKRIEVRMQN
ncbi:energy transducer TonB [Pseudogulbenkiania subflava]|uniref:Protein TonB n=1 Tax=Pseudogulbenkiania subflava DSM 22618 TaxID=1123014 RepID=A0A1Y6BRF7_9NEIS|nr:energy transducer TonB [Pseudogulbenkiania subflava]SMF25125.1 protein TonB [Pseudogulbenkiania subflava DSM 22618]